MLHTSRRLAALAVAIPLVAGLAGCGDEKDKAAAKAPGPANMSNTASTQLPADVPSPGGSAYDYSSQGKPQVWYFALDGSAVQLASLRDSYNTQLTGKGYKLGRQDQEAGAEAESEFSGPHDGTSNFRPLCTE